MIVELLVIVNTVLFFLIFSTWINNTSIKQQLLLLDLIKAGTIGIIVFILIMIISGGTS